MSGLHPDDWHRLVMQGVVLPAPDAETEFYWQAVNERGEPCGHRHRYFTRAVACCLSQERYMRRRYGKRETWIAERQPKTTNVD